VVARQNFAAVFWSTNIAAAYLMVALWWLQQTKYFSLPRPTSGTF